jgi:dCTP deaminase
MTVINGQLLLAKSPIKDMLTTKERAFGVSYGLAEAGYDIRLKQNIYFEDNYGQMTVSVDNSFPKVSRFTIASAMEEFTMPHDLVGVVHDKSTWVRKGLSVFNTVIEPGWNGFLTLEMVYHGSMPLMVPAGAGIAQILFSEVALPAAYNGKYQNQEDRPVAAILEGV